MFPEVITNQLYKYNRQSVSPLPSLAGIRDNAWHAGNPAERIRIEESHFRDDQTSSIKDRCSTYSVIHVAIYTTFILS